MTNTKVTIYQKTEYKYDIKQKTKYKLDKIQKDKIQMQQTQKDKIQLWQTTITYCKYDKIQNTNMTPIHIPSSNLVSKMHDNRSELPRPKKFV